MNPRMKPEPAAVEPAEDRLRVLVIDDERDHAETVAEILEDGGYACAVATSGKEGARRIQSEEFDLVMAVNVYGPYRVTKAFEPLIVAEKGRITNISSISGILASADVSAYSMSKHAVEAFTDSLAQELAERGVTVNVIEPGNYNSEIVKNAMKRGVEPRGFSADRSMYKEPDEVAEAVEKALFEPNPKRRYMIVPNQHEAELTIRKQIEQLVQLNEGQLYTYDRDALIKMLDEGLSRSRPRTP